MGKFELKSLKTKYIESENKYIQIEKKTNNIFDQFLNRKLLEIFSGWS